MFLPALDALGQKDEEKFTRELETLFLTLFQDLILSTEDYQTEPQQLVPVVAESEKGIQFQMSSLALLQLLAG